MMKLALVVLDAMLLASVWWAAFVGAHKSGQVETWREAVAVAGMIAAKVVAFCSALAVVWTATPLTAVARLAAVAAALVAIRAYVRTYGKAHAAAVKAWFRKRRAHA